jgi:hypothetical protein
LQCIDYGSSLRFSLNLVYFKVPALIHSTKPALHSMFQDLINFPNNENDHCLELYARNLLPNFTSIGNEVKIFVSLKNKIFVFY